MMKRKLRLLPLWFLFAAAISFLPVARPACAQKAPDASTQGSSAPAKTPTASPIQIAPAKAASGEAEKAADSGMPPDRAQAYYHLGLASIDEEEAATADSSELANKAIEEYKLALKADSSSPQLNNGLAELYFSTGHTDEAESTVRKLLKSAPNNLDAHRLLGRIYLRALSEGQNGSSSDLSAGSELDKAIAEYATIVFLRPQSVEDRMVLGQLYTVKHDKKRAEEQFKIAAAIEPDSEEVVLNLARLYAESGDIEQEAKTLAAVPVDSRTVKMEDALGEAYEQLKQSKDAIAAFQRAADMEPGNPRTIDLLAQALLSDNQLDAALKRFKELVEADPENAGALVHIGEIQRRQGKYEDALATIREALQKDPDNLEAGYNEGLLLDVLGRFDQAAQVYEKMVDRTSHANGAYTAEEKNNRDIFLARLGAIYQEQNKIPEAIATFQKMIDMGGDTAEGGYEGQVETYINAKSFDKAEQTGRKAVAADPGNMSLKLMLAGTLVEEGNGEEGLALAKGLLGNTENDRQVWMQLGQFYTELHRWKEANDAFNKCAALTTKNEDRTYLLFLRGELAERQKHDGPAERFFRQALDLDPENAMTLNYLGYMLADKGTRLPDALQMIRKAVELDPMNGAYLDSLGWVYFKIGDYELAEENLSQAAARDQTDPTVHDHLGDLYEKTDRIRQAAEQWELSLAEFAKSAPADVEPGDVAKVQRKLENARTKLAKQDHAIGQVKPQ